MVQIVENWSLVQGLVRHIAPASVPEGVAIVIIDVLSVRDIEGYPNLITERAGDRMDVHVPHHAAAELREGTLVTLRVRRGGAHRVFAADDHERTS